MNCPQKVSSQYHPIKKLLGFFSGGWKDEKSIALVDIRCCHNLCGIPFNITPRNQETEIA